MAYDALKNTIRQYIKTNGQQEITGQILQDILIAMVNEYPSLDGYATQSWVSSTLTNTLAGYATQSWVNSTLAGYLPLTGGTMTGNLYMAEGTNIRVTVAEGVRRGVYLKLGMHTEDSTDYCLSLQYLPSLTPLVAGIDIDGNMYGVHFIVNGGTSSDFLKADGSLDSNTYLTSAALAGYLPLSGGTLTGPLMTGGTTVGIRLRAYIDDTAIAIQQYDSTEDSWVSMCKLGGPGYIDGSTYHGDQYIVNNGTSSQFLKADGSLDSNTYLTSASLAGYLPLTGGTMTGNLYMAEGTNIRMTVAEGARRGVYLKLGMHTEDSTDYCLSLQYLPSLTPLVAGIDIDGNIYGVHFIVNGGTSSQFLKADGSVDSSTYALASALSGYLPLSGGTLTGAGGSDGANYGLLSLSVTGNSQFHRGIMMLAPNLTNGDDIIFGFGTSNSSNNLGQLYFHYISSGSTSNRVSIGLYRADDIFNVTGGGNVGIGTTSPSYKLDVNGSLNATSIYENGTSLSNKYLPLTGGTLTNTNKQLTLSSTGTEANIDYKVSNRNKVWVTGSGGWSVNGFTIGWYINGVSNNCAFVITDDNNVGIGTTSPSYKLDVNGTLNATTIYENGTALSSIYNPTSNFKTINGNSIIGTGDITVGGGGGGNYLPLTGGTLTGLLTIDRTTSSGTGNGCLYLIDRGNNRWTRTIHILAPNLTSGNETCIAFGYDDSARNQAQLSFRMAGSGSTSNTFGIGFHSNDDIFNIIAGGGVGIGTTSPSTLLEVVGTITLNYSGNKTLRFGTDGYSYITRRSNAMIIAYEQSGDLILGNKDNQNYTTICNDLCGGAVDSNYDITSMDWNITTAGYATFVSVTQTSDMRYKNVVGDVSMSIYNVANAPLFKFTWKDEQKQTGLHVGSAAQYWQTVLPELVSLGSEKMPRMGMQYDVIALASAITIAKTVVDHEERITILERENKALRDEIARLTAA